MLSVGAGLDTRPLRPNLPPDLRWIEADFADMLSYKARAMVAEQPKCGLEHVAADVTNPAQRASHFAASAPTLMITEGLLMYLPAAGVQGVGADAARHCIRRWLLDAVQSNGWGQLRFALTRVTPRKSLPGASLP